jgi:hypothetical protein
MPNGHKIYKHLPFKSPPKFTQIWDFWVENKPSRNPVPAYTSTDTCRKNKPVIYLNVRRLAPKLNIGPWLGEKFCVWGVHRCKKIFNVMPMIDGWTQKTSQNKNVFLAGLVCAMPLFGFFKYSLRIHCAIAMLLNQIRVFRSCAKSR